MSYRLPMFTLALCLGLAAFGCSKKADQTSPQSADGTAGSATQPAQPDQTTQPQPAAPPKPEYETVTIPTGTKLTVQLTSTLGSKISQPGQSFTASLADPVTVEGKTIIPAGATATGTVVDAKPLGRFKGGASLEVQLTSIKIHGADHAIQTVAVSQTEKGKGKRTAVVAGGAAGLGALIGGLAGGGKGVAIGALAGGGAGGAGAAFTGNKDIVLPAESALTFSLAQPLKVKERE